MIHDFFMIFKGFNKWLVVTFHPAVIYSILVLELDIMGSVKVRYFSSDVWKSIIPFFRNFFIGKYKVKNFETFSVNYYSIDAKKKGGKFSQNQYPKFSSPGRRKFCSPPGKKLPEYFIPTQKWLRLAGERDFQLEFCLEYDIWRIFPTHDLHSNSYNINPKHV